MENSESKDLEQNAQTEEAPAEAEAVDEQPADDKLAAELAQVKDQLLRTMAEYDNHRKRTAKEKLELRADIISNVVSDFLPVMDNSKEALQAVALTRSTSQGVQMIYGSFMEDAQETRRYRGSRATARISTRSFTRLCRGSTRTALRAARSQRPLQRATR